jgi:hypothetical protein
MGLAPRGGFVQGAGTVETVQWFAAEGSEAIVRTYDRGPAEVETLIVAV